jgi:hypothetical protein
VAGSRQLVPEGIRAVICIPGLYFTMNPFFCELKIIVFGRNQIIDHLTISTIQKRRRHISML